MHEFIAMLAHELRNPLAPIRNAVALMERKGLGDPVLETMRQTIDRQSMQLTRIVDELLDVNRIARGQFAVERRAIDLREVLHRAIETSRPLIEQRHQTLELRIPDAALTVNGDPMRLTQVFLNLLNNAAKYTHDRRQHLARGRRGRGLLLRSSARTTASGIAARSRSSAVFELFMQIDPESLRHAGRPRCRPRAGTPDRRAARRARRQARSEGLNHGSEFVVQLPQLGAGGSLALHVPGKTATPRRMRVLVVDDNRDSADSMCMLLEASGQDARAVYDGVSALEIADSFRPEVVLLDIGMPSMDGYQVVRELRGRDFVPPPVIAALTGWGQDSDKKKTQEAGFDHHFTKPVAAEDLLAFLEKVAARS